MRACACGLPPTTARPLLPPVPSIARSRSNSNASSAQDPSEGAQFSTLEGAITAIMMQPDAAAAAAPAVAAAAAVEEQAGARASSTSVGQVGLLRGLQSRLRRTVSAKAMAQVPDSPEGSSGMASPEGVRAERACLDSMHSFALEEDEFPTRPLYSEVRTASCTVVNRAVYCWLPLCDHQNKIGKLCGQGNGSDVAACPVVRT